jgi:hypothetical protein
MNAVIYTNQAFKIEKKRKNYREANVFSIISTAIIIIIAITNTIIIIVITIIISREPEGRAAK